MNCRLDGCLIESPHAHNVDGGGLPLLAAVIHFDSVPDSDKGQVRPNYYRTKVRTVTGEIVEVECFDMIDALGLDFYMGNVLKYLWRAGRKTPNVVDDLRKSRTYIDAEIERRK